MAGAAGGKPRANNGMIDLTRATSRHPLHVALVLVVLLGAGWGFFLVTADRVAAAGVSVGDRIEIRPHELAAPFDTVSVANGSRTIARPKDATLRVPEGFRANLFADGLNEPRWMAVAENGDVFVSSPIDGQVLLLRDRDGDGRAEYVVTYLKRRARPHGLALHNGFLYVANMTGVWAYPYDPAAAAPAGEAVPVTRRGAFGIPGGHWTRNVVFSPDGEMFFVAIGSHGNIGVEPEPRATVQVFDADGGNQRTYAAGLRNPVGIAFHPETDDLYVVVNERDGLGDELVPDYLTAINDGDFFGWPYAYIGQNPQPGLGEKHPGLVARTKVPDLLFRSHSAPIGLVFYDADQFPESYRGDAFVALHGSWNAATPRGYFVAHVPFRDGRPAGYYEAFATGFWAKGERRAKVWGRPAGLTVAKDGSLLIADDEGGAIWRISHEGPGGTSPP